MSFECELIERKEQPTLSVRTHTPVEGLPQLIGQTYGQIMEYMASIGAQPVGEPFVAYYNLDMKNLDIEIGFPVTKALPGQGEIQPSQVMAGKYGVCHYTGPYEQMAPAYEALTGWVKEKGFEPTGLAYEYYLNSPDEVPVSGLKTRIEFPLK